MLNQFVRSYNLINGEVGVVHHVIGDTTFTRASMDSVRKEELREK
jgi:hypothetical protein